jgi:hypothetical protein
MAIKKKKNHYRYWFWLIILVFLGFLGLKTYRSISKSVWDGNQRINLILESNILSIVSYSPFDKEIIFFDLPNNLSVSVSRGYGDYVVRALPKLIDQETKPELLTETIQKNFAIPVDGWIKSPSDNLSNALLMAIKMKGTTSLTDWDLIRLWWRLRTVKGSNIKRIDLADTHCLIQKQLPDQTTVFILDPNILDTVIQKYFSLNSIKNEHLSIQVINNTDYSGLAQLATRTLTNIGLNVVDINNDDENKDKCEVKSGLDLKKSQTVKKIIAIFDCRWVENKEASRADVSVIIGNNYWKKFNSK